MSYVNFPSALQVYQYFSEKADKFNEFRKDHPLAFANYAAGKVAMATGASLVFSYYQKEINFCQLRHMMLKVLPDGAVHEFTAINESETTRMGSYTQVVVNLLRLGVIFSSSEGVGFTSGESMINILDTTFHILNTASALKHLLSSEKPKQE